MTRATLLALASRVEAATWADRELDALVAEAHWQSRWGRSKPKDIKVEPVTSSMDAAVSLVPTNAFIAALSEIAADGMPGCCICTDTSTTPPTEFWGLGLQRGERWEVLARCVTAASLRAIAGSLPD